MVNTLLLKLFDRNKPMRSRLISFLGFVITGFMVMLGAVWPSYYSLVAIVILPTPFIFIFGIFKPAFLVGRNVLGAYLLFSVVVSVVCWTDEIYYVTRNPTIKIDWSWFLHREK